MIKHYALRTQSGSLYLLEFSTHFLGRAKWCLYAGGIRHEVLMLLNSDYTDTGKIYLLTKDKNLLNDQIKQGLVINKITDIAQFKGKMIFCKPSLRTSKVIGIDEFK